MKKLCSCVLMCAAILLPAFGYAQEPAQIEAGEAVYDEHCASCHGEKLRSSGSFPDLRELGAEDRTRFDQMLADGKGQMPSFQGLLTAQELDQLWAYVRSRGHRN